MAPWSAATDHGAEDSAPAPRTRPLIFPAFRFVPERSSRIVVPNASSRQNRTSPASVPGLSYFQPYPRPAKRKQACFCPRFFRYLWLRLRYSRSAKCKQACFCPRFFRYLWLRLRYSRSAKCKQACFCPRFFRYLWLRLRYSRSAKCKQACFCPRLFVSLSSQTQTTQRPWDSYRSHSST